MKTEKFIHLFDEITPTEDKKSQMLDNILKSRRKNSSYSIYYKYATGIASVFAIAVILSSYPGLKNHMINQPAEYETQIEQENVKQNNGEIIQAKPEKETAEKTESEKNEAVTPVIVQSEEARPAVIPSTPPSDEPVDASEPVAASEPAAASMPVALDAPVSGENGIMTVSEEPFTGRAFSPYEEVLFSDMEKYLCYVPEILANEECFAGGRKVDERISATFSNDSVTLDMVIEPKEDFNGEYTSIDDAENLSSFTADGGDVAVSYSIYGENTDSKELVLTAEYFNNK